MILNEEDTVIMIDLHICGQDTFKGRMVSNPGSFSLLHSPVVCGLAQFKSSGSAQHSPALSVQKLNFHISFEVEEKIIALYMNS